MNASDSYSTTINDLDCDPSRLFYDNLGSAFLSQHLWVSLFTSPNNIFKPSILLRSMLACTLCAALMAGNLFIYVRPIVDYDLDQGTPEFTEVLMRCVSYTCVDFLY